MALDIPTIRKQYIRDFYDPGPPIVALSYYNKATKTQFISDVDLQAKADAVGRAYADELSGVYTVAYAHQIAGALSPTAADLAALAIQLDAQYRLIRAAVFEDMMLDPGFVGSISDDKQRAALFDVWKHQILKDRQYTKVRTVASMRSLPIDRY
jgi:hypothetical protein